MARPATKVLTEAELRIMRVLWQRGESTIGDVCAELKPTPARATVQTMLRILERKRYVRHRTDRRSFVYRPVVGRGAASERALKQLLANFFPHSPHGLVLRLLNRQDLDASALERVRAVLDENCDV